MQINDHLIDTPTNHQTVTLDVSFSSSDAELVALFYGLPSVEEVGRGELCSFIHAALYAYLRKLENQYTEHERSEVR